LLRVFSFLGSSGVVRDLHQQGGRLTGKPGANFLDFLVLPNCFCFFRAALSQLDRSFPASHTRITLSVSKIVDAIESIPC
jgi:hypothetical protein